MMGSLVVQECRQTAKSLIYIIYVLCVALFFFTQLGTDSIDARPVPGQESYGTKQSTDSQVVMTEGIQALIMEYLQGKYMTSPIGFTKYVKLSDKEEQSVETIIEELTGSTIAEIEAQQSLENEAQQAEQGVYRPFIIGAVPAKGLTYETFLQCMKQVDELLGGASSYSKETLERSAKVPMTYEDAEAEYQQLVKKDHLTGGYARLFCDYMGIILGIAPIFLAVTRVMRDRRARMQELIQTRRASSFRIVVSRYTALVVMAMIPVLLLSMIMLSECAVYGSRQGIAVDYLGFVKYSLGWLLPEVLAVTAVGMALTELTDTAAAVLVQIIWWFTNLFIGVARMGGGAYGGLLILRHNTEFNYSGFAAELNTLILNRTAYAAAGILLVLLTVWIYEKKRKGGWNLYEKISGNWKRKSAA